MLELTDATFDEAVLDSDIPVLVDFWATWCGPCRVLGPVLDRVSAKFEGKLKVAKVNVDEQMELAQYYNVNSLPTLLLFKEGEVVGQLVGGVPQTKIEALLQEHL